MQILDFKSVLQESVAKLETIFPYAAVLITDTHSFNIRITTQEESLSPAPPARGIVFTVFNGDYLLEETSNLLSKENIQQMVNRLLEKGRKQVINIKSEPIDPGSKLDKDFFIPCEKPLESIPLSQKLEQFKQLRHDLQAMDKRTVMSFISYSEKGVKELFVNRNKALYQEIPYTQVAGMVVMQDQEKQARLWEGKSFQGGFEHAEIKADFFQETIDDCAKILYASRLPNPGEHICIFDPGFSGIFAHEAFGHGTETDMFLKDRAMGQNYLNRQVASKSVNMYDSPAYPGMPGGYFFDHEGQLSAKTQIIKDGILINGLTDLYSAYKLGIERSPNGRREDYSHKAYARMTNTYFGSGQDAFEKILSTTEEGYLLKHASNGMEDPKGWGIQLEGLYLERISSGKLTGEVYSPVIVTGYVPDLLCSIDMVGNKVKMSTLGMCGKGYKEWVKVTDGGPYLRLKARIA